MRDFHFAGPSTSGLPRHSLSSYAIVAVLYVLVVLLVTSIRTQPTRVGSAGSPFASMTAYVSGPAAAGPTASASRPVEPKKTTITTKAAKPAEAQDALAATGASTAASAGAGAGGQAGSGSGPVRLGGGGNLTLIKKVQPVYPVLMQAARLTGQVFLDAIIHPDGTIGDITVLKSTNDAFAQAATAAVKQWRYTAPGFEGILTVSVNFTLP